MPRSHNRTMDNLRLQRRHYQFIADVIANWGGKTALSVEFANALRGTNAHFDRDRFIDACGDAPTPTPKCLLCQSEAK
jgi:hypothetical protein